MARRRRKGRHGNAVARILQAILVVPAAYLTAALIGSIIPVNAGWAEPSEGTTVYIANNGIHADLIMPMRAQGLDWSKEGAIEGSGARQTAASWIAFGSGDRHIFLDTPYWSDVRPGTLVRALAGGSRVIHVSTVWDPRTAERQIKLRPDEYRRLWAAVRADFALDASGRTRRVTPKGTWTDGAFFLANGKANAMRTCNAVVAGWLRLAGVKTSLWPPLVQGLVWRYRHTTN